MCRCSLRFVCGKPVWDSPQLMLTELRKNSRRLDPNGRGFQRFMVSALSRAHEEHHDDLHRKVGDTSDLLQRMQQEHSEQEVALSHAQTGASRHQEDLHKLERIASAHQGRVHAANVEIAQLASKLEELQLPTESFSEASEVGRLQHELHSREEELQAHASAAGLKELNFARVA
ncbi:hypothetical protein AK812_SmicGene17582 [Symbiodinium microadriaticum]|uniref:Uncharacterized protein n=1 Tax=Symbiodinium microadriaticum TaxID=2951 RepID=A0A1Q9DXA8_SYMMI|nr:hypothetical protein AK812_SmicGene17582 [Symbiodinium microadriaticum]